METKSSTHTRLSGHHQQELDEARLLIRQLTAACKDGLRAIEACWDSVDFAEGLRSTALEMEAAIAAAHALVGEEAPESAEEAVSELPF